MRAPAGEASFGNKLLQYSGPFMSVRAVSDRGAFGSIEVAGGEARSDQWYDVAILRDLLVGPGEDVLPLQEQVDFVEKNWSAISSRFSPPEREYTLARLALLRQERAERSSPRFLTSSRIN